MNLPENAIPEDTPPPENEPFWSRFTKRLGYELTKPRTLFRKETAATPTASTWEEIGQHTGRAIFDVYCKLLATLVLIVIIYFALAIVVSFFFQDRVRRYDPADEYEQYESARGPVD